MSLFESIYDHGRIDKKEVFFNTSKAGRQTSFISGTLSKSLIMKHFLKAFQHLDPIDAIKFEKNL